MIFAGYEEPMKEKQLFGERLRSAEPALVRNLEITHIAHPLVHRLARALRAARLRLADGDGALRVPPMHIAQLCEPRAGPIFHRRGHRCGGQLVHAQALHFLVDAGFGGGEDF